MAKWSLDVLDKQKLIDIGLKHSFLNYVDHETPRNYFPHHRDVYLDTDNVNELRESVLDLYQLLDAIYAEVGIV